MIFLALQQEYGSLTKKKIVYKSHLKGIGPIFIYVLTNLNSADKSLPLNHIFSTPAGVFIHHYLPLAQHLWQGGEERFVSLNVAHKLPAGSSGIQEVIIKHQTRYNYTQLVLPQSSRFSNQTCPNTDRYKRQIGLPCLFVTVINADSVLPCSHMFI